MPSKGFKYSRENSTVLQTSTAVPVAGIFLPGGPPQGAGRSTPECWAPLACSWGALITLSHQPWLHVSAWQHESSSWHVPVPPLETSWMGPGTSARTGSWGSLERADSVWGPGQVVLLIKGSEKRLVGSFCGCSPWITTLSSSAVSFLLPIQATQLWAPQRVEMEDFPFGMVRQDFIQLFKGSVCSGVGQQPKADFFLLAISSVLILPLPNVFEDKYFCCRTNSSPFMFMPKAPA